MTSQAVCHKKGFRDNSGHPIYTSKEIKYYNKIKNTEMNSKLLFILKGDLKLS